MPEQLHPFELTFNDAFAAIPAGASRADAMVVGARAAAAMIRERLFPHIAAANADDRAWRQIEAVLIEAREWGEAMRNRESRVLSKLVDDAAREDPERRDA